MALPYLEYCKSVRETSQDKFLYPLIEFYSQPFKSDLIIELFANWNKVDSSYYEGEGSEILFVYNFNETEIIWWHINDEFQSEGFNAPKTLNDFLTVLKLRDVCLTWKQEIVERYFSGKAVLV